MDLELVSFPLCPYVHRVATLLHEKGATFSIRYIDLKNKPDWFVAISPRGRVPVLVADGRPLFESLALLEFVDETVGPRRMLPEDPFERARHRAYLAFATEVFAAQYRVLVARSEAELETATAGLRAQLSTFEAALDGGGPLFTGEGFSLVDAAIAPALQRMAFLDERWGIDLFGPLPSVRRWATALAARPTVNKGLPPDFEGHLRRLLADAALGAHLPAGQ